VQTVFSIRSDLSRVAWTLLPGIGSCQAPVGLRTRWRARMGLLREASRSLWAALIVLGISHSVAASREGGRRLIPMARVPRLWRGEPPRRRRGSAPWRLAGTVSKTCANGPASTRPQRGICRCLLHSRAVAVPQRLRPTAARRRRMCGRCLPALGIRIARSSTISRQQPARGSRRTRGYPRRPAKKASLRCQLKVRWAACP